MFAPKKRFMELAIQCAKTARKRGDYAIGAVIVRGDKTIASCGNQSKTHESPIGHAETLAIIKASKILKRRHLSDCVLYATNEPCAMCAAVAIWAKLGGIVYGARTSDMKRHRQKRSNSKYLWRTIDISAFEIVRKSTEKIALTKDFMRSECKKLFHD